MNKHSAGCHYCGFLRGNRTVASFPLICNRTFAVETVSVNKLNLLPSLALIKHHIAITTHVFQPLLSSIIVSNIRHPPFDHYRPKRLTMVNLESDWNMTEQKKIKILLEMIIFTEG